MSNKEKSIASTYYILICHLQNLNFLMLKKRGMRIKTTKCLLNFDSPKRLKIIENPEFFATSYLKNTVKTVYNDHGRRSELQKSEC